MIHSVEYITCDYRAIDALQFMKNKNISFVPIIDKNNQIMSVLSIRDIRIVCDYGSLNILDKPVIDYISLVRQSSPISKVFFFKN